MDYQTALNASKKGLMVKIVEGPNTGVTGTAGRMFIVFGQDWITVEGVNETCTTAIRNVVMV